jgi:hypothetical protein
MDIIQERLHNLRNYMTYGTLSIYMTTVCYDKYCKSFTRTCGDLHCMDIAMHNYDKRCETLVETPSMLTHLDDTHLLRCCC